MDVAEESKRCPHALWPLLVGFILVGFCSPYLQATPLTQQDELVIREITLVGNSVMNEEELATLIRPYINRRVTLGQLQELRASITRRYVKLGYINSGAVIPDQDIGDGILQIQIVEGRLSQVNVEGNQRLSGAYFTEKLLSDWKVLNIADLQEKIRALHNDPLIEKVDVKLKPGSRLGEGILDVTVTESRPYSFNVGINNHRSPSVGEYRIEVAGIHENLTGHADRIAAQFGYTEGLKDASLEYAIPLNSQKTTLTIGAGFSDSSIIEEPFKPIGIRSETERYFLGITHPFYTRPEGYHSASIILEHAESRSFLLDDMPYELSPGATDGVARVSVIRLGNEWLRKGKNQVLALRSRFSFGLDVGDATINGTNDDGKEIPDGEFTSWLGQLQWLQRLAWRDSLLVIDTSYQHAFDPLLSLEKFGLGGADTVRGYRENVLVRDRTLFFSLEHRLPIFGPRWQWVSFYDYGRGTNINDDGDAKYLRSVGGGLRWQDVTGRYHGELYWADPQEDILTLEDEDSLQDRGWHFSLDASF